MKIFSTYARTDAPARLRAAVPRNAFRPACRTARRTEQHNSPAERAVGAAPVVSVRALIWLDGRRIIHGRANKYLIFSKQILYCMEHDQQPEETE